MYVCTHVTYDTATASTVRRGVVIYGRAQPVASFGTTTSSAGAAAGQELIAAGELATPGGIDTAFIINSFWPLAASVFIHHVITNWLVPASLSFWPNHHHPF